MRRKLAILTVLAVLVVFALPLAPVQAASTTTVHGTVTGPNGPIPSASVKVEYLAKGGLPKRVATVTTAADGTWTYSGRAGDNRFTISAEGYVTHVEVLHTQPDVDYTLDVALALVPPPTGSITGQIRGSGGAGLHGYAYFYKRNADGTWPTGYMRQVESDATGHYTSGQLGLGEYKVRLFTVHTGVQWYRYAADMASATPIVLDTAGQVVSGVDADYPPPAP